MNQIGNQAENQIENQINFELANDTDVIEWLESYNEPSTKNNFKNGLRLFLKFSGTTLEKVKDLAKNNQFVLKRSLMEARAKAIKSGYSNSSGRGMWEATKSFLINRLGVKEVELKSTRKSGEFKNKQDYLIKKAITQEYAHALIENCDSITKKAVITFLHQSGQRKGVLTGLKIKHIKEIIERKEGPYVIQIPKDLSDSRNKLVLKVELNYMFAVGEDTAFYCRQMIEERKEKGEKIDDESWLFRSYSIKTDGKMKKLSYDSPSRSISGSQILSIVKEAAKGAGIQESKTTKLKRVFNWLTPKAFRANFKPQMRLGWQANPTSIKSDTFLDFLQGHEPPYKGAYDEFDVEFVRKEYAKAENFLRVREKPNISKEQMQFDREYQELEDLVQKLKVKLNQEDELQLIKEDMEKNFQQKLDSLEKIRTKLDQLDMEAKRIKHEKLDSKLKGEARVLMLEEKPLENKIQEISQIGRKLEEKKIRLNILLERLNGDEKALEIAQNEELDLESKLEQLEKLKDDLEEKEREEEDARMELHSKLAVFGVYVGSDIDHLDLHRDAFIKELEKLKKEGRTPDNELKLQIKIAEDLITEYKNKNNLNTKVEEKTENVDNIYVKRDELIDIIEKMLRDGNIEKNNFRPITKEQSATDARWVTEKELPNYIKKGYNYEIINNKILVTKG
jgi:integrase